MTTTTPFTPTHAAARLVREALLPGALSLTVYPDVIEVGGTLEDMDAVNCEIACDDIDIELLRELFTGWPVEDER